MNCPKCGSEMKEGTLEYDIEITLPDGKKKIVTIKKPFKYCPYDDK